MIRVRSTNGRSFNTEDGTKMMGGPELVRHRLHGAWTPGDAFEVLTEIIGRLVDRLPANEWLDIVGSDSLERVE